MSEALAAVFALLLVIALAGAEEPRLKVIVCAVSADSVSTPYSGIDYGPYVESAWKACGLPPEHSNPDWWPKRRWSDGTPRMKPVTRGAQLPDTGEITDGWGRHYFEPVAHEKGTLPKEWRVRTEKGVIWRLHLVSEEEPDTVNLRRASFELWRNDSLAYRGETRHDSFHDFVESAWVWQDTCIITLVTATRAIRQGRGLKYDADRRILRNGVDLPYRNCFGYTYFIGHPFFFQQNSDSTWGWTYNGTSGTEKFETLFFDQCCEPAMWDVHWQPDGFGIFAKRGGVWYRVAGQFTAK